MFDTKHVLKSMVRQSSVKCWPIPIFVPKKTAHDGLIASPHAGNGTYRATKNQLFQCSFQVLIFCNRLAWLHTYRHTDIHTGRQADRQTGRQADRQMHTYIHADMQTYIQSLKKTLTYGMNITKESHGIGAQQLDPTGPLVKLLEDWVD